MNSLQKKISKVKPDISENTVNTYLSNIKLIIGIVNPGKKRINLKLLQDAESIVDVIKNLKVGLATKKNYMTTILVVSKAIDLPDKVFDIYIKYHATLAQEQHESYIHNEKTEKEERNWITRQKILDKVDELKTKADTSLYNYQCYLLLNLYTLLPPMRNDFANVMVYHKKIPETINTNYIDLKNKIFVLQKYKTSKFYGKKDIALNDELVSIIEDWFLMRERLLSSPSKCKYLLIQLTQPEKSITSNYITKLLNKIFHPLKISSTILRKVYISEKYPVVNTFKQMQDDAYVMCHDISTSKKIYSKKL